MTVQESQRLGAPTDVEHDVTVWLEGNWDPDLTVADWWDRVGTAGWTAPHFPIEWGGLGYPRRSVHAVFGSGRADDPGRP